MKPGDYYQDDYDKGFVTKEEILKREYDFYRCIHYKPEGHPNGPDSCAIYLLSDAPDRLIGQVGFGTVLFWTYWFFDDLAFDVFLEYSLQAGIDRVLSISELSLHVQFGQLFEVV